MNLLETIPRVPRPPWVPRPAPIASPLGPHVLLVGDGMIDQWITVTVAGVATDSMPSGPAAPHWKTIGTVSYPGGAGNVRANLRALGVRADYVTQTGNWPMRTRYVTCGGAQLARIDGPDDTVNPTSIMALEDTVAMRFPQAVVVADYGKGAVTAEVRRWVMTLGVPVYVDTKQAPWDWAWPSTVPITFFPNEHEWDQWREGYEALADGCGIVRKMGAGGVDYFHHGDMIHARATNPAPVSTCGAGDVVLAAWVAMVATGTAPSAVATRVMDLVGHVVGRPYTNVVTPVDLVPTRLVSLSDSEESRWTSEGGR